MLRLPAISWTAENHPEPTTISSILQFATARLNEFGQNYGGLKIGFYGRWLSDGVQLQQSTPLGICVFGFSSVNAATSVRN